MQVIFQKKEIISAFKAQRLLEHLCSARPGRHTIDESGKMIY